MPYATTRDENGAIIIKPYTAQTAFYNTEETHTHMSHTLLFNMDFLGKVSRLPP